MARDWMAFIRRRWVLSAAVILTSALAVGLVLRRAAPPAAPAGDRLAGNRSATDSVLALDATAQRLAGIELHVVTPSGQSELSANGLITFDANRVSVIASPVDARVVSVRADLGQQVLAGATLAVLESREVGAMRGDLERARVSAEIAQKNHEREKRLFLAQISPQKELLDAEAAFRTADADFNSALSRLRAIGASEGSGGSFALVTRVGGTVVERNASPGQNVGPSTNLFTVADLSHVWITVDVYEGDLARVRQGAPASVAVGALPGESFIGRVTYAGGVVDTTSRTFKVRVELENAARRLRPGMFAEVHLRPPQAPGSAASIVIPEVAVQELNGKSVVFVTGAVSGQFIVRVVTLGPRAGNGTVTVTHGLAVGERIVVKGAFQLKAELAKASVGGGE
jgi:cobalt-zinc-cadmium efflux system membrane fusion protein